jgi:heme-degrading monooxygenase HmoA
MPEVVVLVKVTIDPVDLENLKDYRHRNAKVLKKSVPGFNSISVWQSDGHPTNYMILFTYSDEESAETGLEVSTSIGPLVESLSKPVIPPEVRRGHAEYFIGKRPEKIDIGSLASFSFRVAQPGMGDDLQSELARIFGELSMIDGYLGSMTCRNESLQEEVTGVVFWSNREAFETSLPSKVFYEVSLYQRVS